MPYVSSWHKADMPTRLTNVRFRLEGRPGTGRTILGKYDYTPWRHRTSRLVPILSLAQEVFRKVGERGPWQRRKRQRAGDLDRGQSQSCRQQPVEQALAEPLR